LWIVLSLALAFTFYLHLILQLKRRVVTIDGYTDVPPNDEKKLLKAVAVQPVSVGICGSARAFQLYSKVKLNDIRKY
jgi:hypothetical protein